LAQANPEPVLKECSPIEDTSVKTMPIKSVASVLERSDIVSNRISELDVSEPKQEKSVTPETPNSGGSTGDTTDEGNEISPICQLENTETSNKEVSSYLNSLAPLDRLKGSGKKIELTADCLSKTYKRILERRRLLTPALESFRSADISNPNENATMDEMMENVRKWILEWSNQEEVRKIISELKQSLGLTKVVIPYIEVAASMRQIQLYLQLPKQMYRTKTNLTVEAFRSLQKLSLLIDQSPREHLFYLIVSKTDKQTTFASPQKSAQSFHGATFTLCQGCSKMFGTLVCSACGCAHYCGKECQVAHWKRHSKICRGMQKYLREMQVFTL